MSKIEVGTAAVNWGFDPLYTWVATPRLEQMLDQMATAGYAGTEVSYNFPSDARFLRNELERRRLRAAASFHAINLRDRTEHEAALAGITPVVERLAALGSCDLILSDKPSPERIAIAGRVAADGTEGLSPVGWRALSDGLMCAAELAASRGMSTSFHPHVGTYVETRAEIDQLCALTDPALVKLCPDTGHLAYAGVAPEEVFRDYAGRIGYVHLKDVDPAMLATVREKGIDFVGAVQLGLFVELGSGMVSFQRIVGALRDAGYQGWLIVEQDAPKNPYDAAVRNRQFLREEFCL